MNANDSLAPALDRFDVPTMSAGLADRIAAAAAKPVVIEPRPPLRRDRRGLWRRGRQVALATVAAGMLSAAAVASGLLGKVGIDVPVLTAMLAPKPKPAPTPHHVSTPRTARVAPKPDRIASPPVVVSTVPPVLADDQRLARREILIERRVARQQFAAEHPVAAAAIREKVRQRLRERAIERRATIGPGPLDPETATALRQANRRDARRAAAMIDRRIEARRERAGALADAAAPTLPAMQGPVLPRAAVLLDPVVAERRELRRQRFRQMSPDQRAAVIERRRQFRAQRMQRPGPPADR